MNPATHAAARVATWSWQHPRTTALAALAAGGVVEPFCWLAAPMPAIWWAGSWWRGLAPPPIRSGYVPTGTYCPDCGQLHDGREVVIGINNNGQARCIEINRPNAAQSAAA